MSETLGRFGVSLFGDFLFDDLSSGVIPPTPTSDDFTFEDYGLMNADVWLSDVIYNGPSRELVRKAYPRANGAYIEVDQFRENTIVLRGVIKKDTRALLEAELDSFKEAFATPAGVLKILFAGASRYFDCYASTLEGIFQRNPNNINFIPFEITLLCLHPFGRNGSRDSFTGANATASSTTYEIDNDGSAPVESIATLALSTAGTVEKLKWENLGTGEAIIIDNGGAFSNGDTLKINGETKQVLKNNVAIVYEGVFPSLVPGTNSCKLSIITGSGQTIAVTEQHYQRFY